MNAMLSFGKKKVAAPAGAVSLKFCGGVGHVTGANFLLKTPGGQMLVDCGMVQGSKEDRALNWEPWIYDPSKVGALVITHAHIDHIGRVPKIVKDGFSGPIYSTAATKELSVLMLADAAKVGALDAKALGREPLYNQADVERALDRWETIGYHEEKEILPGLTVYLRDSGHILGSANVRARVSLPGGGEVAVGFSGDLGNSPTLLMPDPEPAPDIDYLVTESVYGDRRHEGRDARRDKLREVFSRVLARGGTVVVPTFSLEKTQSLLYELNELVEAGELPKTPVYLDSPLAIGVTEVYAKHIGSFRRSVREDAASGDHIFDFPGLVQVDEHRLSEAINQDQRPKIVLAGSGMSEGGRVRSHERHFLGDPKSALVLVGYQVLGSLGRRLQDGAKSVRIDGQDVKVRAEVAWVSGYSSHADTDGLLAFAERCAAGERLRKVFTAMGEPKAAMFLAQRIRDELGVEAVHPEEGQEVPLG
jgi:metallo-beta-lactamase family protein